jgi:hypothetical protein
VHEPVVTSRVRDEISHNAEALGTTFGLYYTTKRGSTVLGSNYFHLNIRRILSKDVVLPIPAKCTETLVAS